MRSAGIMVTEKLVLAAFLLWRVSGVYSEGEALGLAHLLSRLSTSISDIWTF